jgi:hypothetical protein
VVLVTCYRRQTYRFRALGSIISSIICNFTLRARVKKYRATVSHVKLSLQQQQVQTTGAWGIHINMCKINSILNQFELLYVVLCAVRKGLASECYASTL